MTKARAHSHGIVGLNMHLGLDPRERWEPCKIESFETKHSPHASPTLSSIPAFASFFLKLFYASFIVPDGLHLIHKHDAREDGKEQSLKHQTYQENDIQGSGRRDGVTSLRVDVSASTS